MEQRQPLSVALPGGSEALLGGQFDSKSYVNGLRKLIPLEALCSSISSEIEKAYEALLCVINDRHQAVLKLASDLRIATERLPRVRNELTGYLALCTSLLQNADSALQDIQHLACKHATFCQHMCREQIVHFLYTTMQSDLRCLQAIKASEQAKDSGLLFEIVATDIEATHRILIFLQTPTTEHQSESAADVSAYNEAILQLTKAVETARHLTSECLANALTTQLQALSNFSVTDPEFLSAAPPPPTTEPTVFANQISSRNGLLSSISRLCYALLCIKEENKVRGIVRKLLVDSVLSEALELSRNSSFPENTEGQGDVEQGVYRNNAATLDRFVCAVQKAMTHEFAPFVALLKTWNTVDTGNFDELLKTSNQRMYQRLRKLQLVQTCLISSFLEHIQASFSSCFVPVFPDLFVANFLRLHQCVDNLLALLTPSERSAFLAQKDWLRFTLQWKTQIYEARRSRLLFDEFQKCLEQADYRTLRCSNDDASPKMAFIPYHFEATQHFINFVNKALDKNQLIHREFPSVLRLIAQMAITVYGGWIQRALDDLSEMNNAPQQTDQLLNTRNETQQKRIAYLIQDLLFVEFELLSETITSNSVTLRNLLLNEASKNELCNALSQDHQTSCQWVGVGPYDDKDKADSVERSRALTQQCCTLLSQMLHDERQKLQGVLLRGISNVVDDALGAMRGIPALYRMTNRAITGQPSTYVDVACQPLEILKILLTQNEHGDESLTTLVRHISDSVFNTYSTRLKEVLSTVQLQERSLRRLQRSKQAREDSRPPMELDQGKTKILGQLEIDGNAFSTRWAPYLGPTENYGKAQEDRSSLGEHQHGTGYHCFRSMMRYVAECGASSEEVSARNDEIAMSSYRDTPEQ